MNANFAETLPRSTAMTTSGRQEIKKIVVNGVGGLRFERQWSINPLYSAIEYWSDG